MRSLAAPESSSSTTYLSARLASTTTCVFGPTIRHSVHLARRASHGSGQPSSLARNDLQNVPIALPAAPQPTIEHHFSTGPKHEALALHEGSQRNLQSARCRRISHRVARRDRPTRTFGTASELLLARERPRLLIDSSGAPLCPAERQHSAAAAQRRYPVQGSESNFDVWSSSHASDRASISAYLDHGDPQAADLRI